MLSKIVCMIRFFFASIFILWLNTTFAQNGNLTIQIEGIQNLNGNMMIAAFSNQQDFNGKENPSFVNMTKVSDSIQNIDFKDIIPGKYAIAVYHDQNSDKQLNTSSIGIPSEGYGFSGNYNSIFKKPKFKDCKIDIKSDTIISIKMHYW